jgi:2-succinyl-5-enolpyruvyl-6-hydroxy-3-cyclohexene-1-carboxylate synthase
MLYPMRSLVLLLWLMVSLPMAQAAVYTCSDGRGGSVQRNVPCTTPVSPEEQRQQALTADLASIRKRALPSDYQQRVAAAFAQRFPDATTRQISYSATPYGSLVCGRITARQAAGASEGAQPFAAYFDEQGRLAALKVYTAQELQNSGSLGSDLERHLVQDCGFP